MWCVAQTRFLSALISSITLHLGILSFFCQAFSSRAIVDVLVLASCGAHLLGSELLQKIYIYCPGFLPVRWSPQYLKRPGVGFGKESSEESVLKP